MVRMPNVCAAIAIDSVHVHRHGLMKDGQHQRAAVHYHPLAAQSGPDKADFFRGPLIQAGDHQTQG
jgi:hypothetical protein